jgi:U3 small nucleolar RNA-associated protein 19
MQLLHRAPPAVTAADARGEVAAAALPDAPVWRGEDVFDAAEGDPAKARALESSLWELDALRRHASPAVAAGCAALARDLGDRRRTAEGDVAAALAESYATLFGREAGRRLKAAPTAFFAAAPTALFAPAAAADFPGWE